MITTEHYERITQHISALGSEIKALKSSIDVHNKADEEWKLSAEPILLMGRSVQGFSVVLKWLIYIILSGAAIVASFYAAIKWLKE